MSSTPPPIAISAMDVPARAAVSFYPEPFNERMAGRQKRQLGEFVYVVSGHPTLRTDQGRMRLAPGMCAGFRAGTGDSHHLHNETTEEVLYLEIGDRTSNEEVTYPDDDLKFVRTGGKARFAHKDGTPY